MGRKKANLVEVKDLRPGTVVCFQGEWGVLEGKFYLDRWIGNQIRLSPTDEVEVAPPIKKERR